MQSDTVESVFARAWVLLRSNWSIMVPGFLAGAASGVLQALLLQPLSAVSVGDASFLSAAALERGLVSLIGLLASIVAITYTTGMAQAAWERGTATFADGGRAFTAGAGHVFMAIIVLTVAAFLATLLSVFTLGLALLAFFYFSMYTLAAVVVGRRSGLEGFLESVRIASTRVSTTITVIVGLVGIFVLVGVLATVLSFVPFLGLILAAIIFQGIAAYFTLVIVGEYLALRSTPPTLPTVR
jgi:hypothetical protein